MTMIVYERLVVMVLLLSFKDWGMEKLTKHVVTLESQNFESARIVTDLKLANILVS